MWQWGRIPKSSLHQDRDLNSHGSKNSRAQCTKVVTGVEDLRLRLVHLIVVYGLTGLRTTGRGKDLQNVIFVHSTPAQVVRLS